MANQELSYVERERVYEQLAIVESERDQLILDCKALKHENDILQKFRAPEIFI